MIDLERPSDYKVYTAKSTYGEDFSYGFLVEFPNHGVSVQIEIRKIFLVDLGLKAANNKTGRTRQSVSQGILKHAFIEAWKQR